MALVSGPVAFIASQSNTPDPLNLYLVVGVQDAMDADLRRLGVVEASPYRAPFARLVQASPAIHPKLVALGYWTLPAGALAAICNTETV